MILSNVDMEYALRFIFLFVLTLLAVEIFGMVGLFISLAYLAGAYLEKSVINIYYGNNEDVENKSESDSESESESSEEEKPYVLDYKKNYKKMGCTADNRIANQMKYKAAQEKIAIDMRNSRNRFTDVASWIGHKENDWWLDESPY